ncbi:MAG TPA: glycosyltransferase family 39 protein [Lacipirellulaceae bacterium]|jgi:4-amino-4-deoxy-L-arabinose transferase-like glycosyltransferase|nr:glycosyltransferase family 39 protein [Lacipirellulaceae bacterium]
MIKHWRSSVFVAGIALPCFFLSLGSIHLWDEDEPKNAVCGREMFVRNDWVIPTYNDKLSLDKPVLLYWGMILAYHFLGVTELAARLPSALAGVGTVVLTFHLGRLLIDARTGLLASCLTASALMFSVLARGATPDSLLILCVLFSLWSFVAGVAARRGGHFCGTPEAGAGSPRPIHEQGLPLMAWLGIYGGMGFAVLAKGPIGIVMPLGILGTFLLFFDRTDAAPLDASWLKGWLCDFAPRRVWGVFRSLRVGWGLLLVAVIALPWYILVAVRTDGEWVTGFLGTHNIGRFMQPMEHHRGLPIYYLVAIMAGFFPGSVFLPVSLWATAKEIRNGSIRRPAAGFLLCWIGCFVGFFTLAATKLPNYVVPCYPALAIACGSWLSAAMRKSESRGWQLWIGYGSLSIAGLAISIALTVAARNFLNLSFDLALPGVVAMVGGIICLSLLYRKQVSASVAAFVVTCLALTLSASTYTAWRANGVQDGPRFAARILTASDVTAGRTPRVATCDYLPPSLVYYLGRSVERLSDPTQVSAFFDGGGSALIMFRSTYDKNRSSFPADIAVVAEEQRFLKSQTVVLLGRADKLARSDTNRPNR